MALPGLRLLCVPALNSDRRIFPTASVELDDTNEVSTNDVHRKQDLKRDENGEVSTTKMAPCILSEGGSHVREFECNIAMHNRKDVNEK